MSDEEVNKIIAEFMGLKYKGGWIYNNDRKVVFTMLDYYTKSLDALVSVFLKLDLYPSISYAIDDDLNVRYTCDMIDAFGNSSVHALCKTIQQAAAHATAKAILELKKDD
jgi:hypothetical protein